MIKADHLIKRKSSLKDIDSVASRRKVLRDKGRDYQLLERCRNLWNNLDDFRKQRARCLRFAYGDQWADLVEVNGKTVTYREYLKKQGNVVIQTNQIKNRLDTIVGVMVKDRSEPVCHSIDRDEQQYGEIMTSALQANCDKNQLVTMKIKFLKDLCLGGLAVGKESYDDTSGPSRRLDSWTTYCNPNTMILDGEVVDPRNWDMSIVGQFFDKSFEDICAMFGRSLSDYEALKEIYNSQSYPFREGTSVPYSEQMEGDEIVFERPTDPTKCRVYEIWTRESKARIRLNDLMDGTEEIIDADDYAYRKEIRDENKRREKLAKASQFTQDETPYIVGDGYGRDESEQNGFFTDTFWYCRFLAPDGTILWEGESPYADRCHPFSICTFPFVDGKLTGYLTDAIDHNIAMNRAIILHDWLLRAQSKGVTVVPKAIVPNDVSYEQFANSWTSVDDIVYIDVKPGMEKLMPQVFHGAAQTFDVAGLLATYSKLMDNGTPVNGALQGKTPNSGTSGALYAQMATNASTPIAALMEDFQKFVENILNKKMKNIAMFYSPDRLRSIAGRIDGILDVDSLNLNEFGDLEYDLKIKESADTPVFRAIINQDAKEFLMANLISFEEYLQIADVPYADKILQGRQARQAEAEQVQRSQQMQQGLPISAQQGGAAPAQNTGGAFQ